MSTGIKPGAVIFAADHTRLAKFYVATTGMSVRISDEDHTLLESETFELVLHALAGEPAPDAPAAAREDAYIKPFFLVDSLAETRMRAAASGGRLRPANEEWEARGFRACEGADPEGNVIQFRERASR